MANRVCYLEIYMVTPLFWGIDNGQFGHAFTAFGLPAFVKEVSSCDGW